MDAILLLGHGSRLTEANKALKQMAQMIMEIGDIPLVEIAFLQFEKPDFFDGISACIAKGAGKIIIHPYFLYKGRHFEEDIAEMIGEAQRMYPEIEFAITEPLGVHENIVRVVLERLKDIKPFKLLQSHEIEEKSMGIITNEMGETGFKDIEMPVVKRVIHATGDFDFAQNMRFHPEAVEAGIRAIKNGMNILVDVRMVEAGINKGILARYGGKVICSIQGTEGIVEDSRHSTQTRAEKGVDDAMRGDNNIGIVAVGNAPTALYKTMKLIENMAARPELVIGVPVGFVKAVESKEVLLHMKYPFITSLGRKGGSPVAVAIVNALLKMADKGSNT
ncbi:MAG: precorrin-8X methylmutase [bacterium]|nr:precorrin-8X methylmutase [bacterium]